ncbi:MAG: hypothetical protein ABSD44_12780 [Terracidiphilus sp.]
MAIGAGEWRSRNGLPLPKGEFSVRREATRLSAAGCAIGVGMEEFEALAGQSGKFSVRAEILVGRTIGEAQQEKLLDRERLAVACGAESFIPPRKGMATPKLVVFQAPKSEDGATGKGKSVQIPSAMPGSPILSGRIWAALRQAGPP